MGELDAAVVVDFPLRGEWLAQNTPGTRIPSHGTDLLGQRYAFDLLRVDARPGVNVHPGGRLRSMLLGVPARDCYGWGQPIHAAIDGEVVAEADGVSERAWIHPVRELAGVLWTALTYDPVNGFASVAGNHLIIGGGDLFAAYAHLVPGSLAVHAGESVRAGDVIGRVGHSGNSTAPHLHFQLMDGPDPRTAAGVPCSFRAYEVLRDGTWQRVTESIPTDTERIRWAP